MSIFTSLKGKSIHVVVGLAQARSAYDKVLRPFLTAGAISGYHESPKAFLASLINERPVAHIDMLIVGPWFQDDMKSEEFVDIMLSRGFIGMSYIGSGVAYQILKDTPDLQRLVSSVLIDHPEAVSRSSAANG